jgi:hypothetical protein
MESLEVQVAAVRDVVGAALWRQKIEEIDVVQLTIGDVNEPGN